MLLMGLFFSVSSCDYLAVSDQMSGGLQNTDQIFENVAYTIHSAVSCRMHYPLLTASLKVVPQALPPCRSRHLIILHVLCQC